jgi:hypothetical protein
MSELRGDVRVPSVSTYVFAQWKRRRGGMRSLFPSPPDEEGAFCNLLQRTSSFGAADGTDQ